ncbi:MAG TPA: prepilin-type N-terminal cleavage/methylation domain-containing protein [Bryobacteraceae bacterium]|jgi:type II secretory pathway component PulJ|nr:prepilin-type N-terminal cleavage/methylation domain-containing protein [Bryobacteraceae bacterium]
MKHREAGVTLVEILIAVSLLSLLSVGMLVAMRLGFSTMDKTDKRLVENRRVSNTRGIIENEINGFVYSVANYRPKPKEINPITFLQTEEQSMRFVTSYSIEEAWRGRLQIAALQVIPGEKNEGVRLIVNETPYTGPEQAGQEVAAIEQGPAGMPVVRFVPTAAGPRSFVLADHLSYCRFSYLEPLPDPPFQRWRPDWVQLQRLPLAVRIEMVPIAAGTGIRTSDLHIGAVTVPFKVNRLPGSQYADTQ